MKLLGPARYCATSDQLVIECKALLDARLVFEEMPSKYTTTVHSVHSLQHSILIFLVVPSMPPLPMSVLDLSPLPQPSCASNSSGTLWWRSSGLRWMCMSWPETTP